MPPARRSTRSVRASEEPATAPASKRKRSGPIADDDDFLDGEDTEEPRKPASRTARKPSVTRAPTTRKASGTSATRRAQVIEDEEEDMDEISRPAKKSRSSNERDEKEVVVKEEAKPAKRASRARAPAAPPKKQEIIVLDSDLEDDSGIEEIPPPPKAKPAARKPPSKRSSATPASRGTTPRTSRAVKAEPVAPVLEEVEEEDEEEPEKPARRATRTSNGSSKKGTSAPKKAAVEESEDELAMKDEGEEDDYEPPSKPAKRTSSARGSSARPPSARASSSRASASRNSSARASSLKQPAEDPDAMEEDEDEDDDPPPRPPSKRGKPASKPAKRSSKVASPSESPPPPPVIQEPIPEEDEEESTPAPVKPQQADGDEEMEFLTAKPRTPKKEKGKGKQKAKDTDKDEQESFEEEISLLDTNGESPRKKAATPTPAVEKEPEGPRARLTIHKLVLVNFKSYAGRQEIGPFHKSFSAIVGPNGSGKSNTIDALLFVFGYRAAKMRQAKLSELIHNSVHHPDLDTCSVEVHFREIIDEPGSDSFEIVPNSTLVVTRTAYKNDSSDYTINRKKSTYKEVQTLLKGRGIDLDHNRFLILQGEVESIAQMKPKAPTKHEDGLLEYLEDIIGTAELKPTIEEALVKLEELQEHRTLKLNRLRITEGQKNALEEEKAAALEHIRLKNELMRAKSFLYQFYLSSCFKQEVKLNEGKRGVEEKLKTIRAENQDELALHAELEADYNAKKAAFDEVEAAMAVTSKELEGNQQNEKALTQKHKDAEKRYKKLIKSKENDEKALEAAKAAIVENEETMASQTEKVHDLEAELVREQENLEKVMDSLKDKTKHFQDQIQAKQRELQPWAAKTNEAKRKVDVCSNEREALVQKASDAAKALAEAQEQFKNLQNAQVSKLDEQKGLKTRRQGLQAEIADADRKHKELAAEVTRFSKEASHRASRFQEARSNQSQGRSNNRVLDGLQTLAASGRVSGFHGRLGGLGTIDSKYDVAITTACGSLNNMVCDTVEQATACMNHLRIQNIGRANFMVLEKINGEPRNEPAPLKRLYDLVKPREPRFAKVFWKALSDTLVADNIDEANSVAVGGRRRYRVVTLDGQLVDSSGTMSGGGNTVQRGGMNEKFAAQAVSAAEMGKLEKDHNAAAAQLQEAQSRLRAAEARVEALRHEGPQVDKALQMLEVDVKDTANRLKDAEKRMNELGARSKPDAGDQKRIKELEREHAQLAASLEKLQEKSGAIEAEIEALNEKVKAAGGSKLLMQRSKVDSIKQYIDIATQEVTKAEVGLDKARKDVKRLSAATGGHDEAIAEAEAEVEEFMEALAKAHESVEEGEEALREASNQLEGIKEELHEVKDKFEETSQALRDFRAREEKYKTRLADVEGKLKENTALIDNYERLHAGLSLEDIDEDDDDEEEAAAPTADGEPSERPIVKPDPEGRTSSRSKIQGDKDERGFRLYTEPELAQQTQGALQANIQSLDEHLDKTKPNPAVLKRYREREEEFDVRAKELDDATAERDAQKAHYDALCKSRFDTFMKGFNEISNKLKEMYQMITLGGNAELELVDSMDPFSEGIIFSVMPPKKSWRNISNLSGGEKTLSSLALVFALHTYKPTPLYFMDEIDAALDFRNVSIVANYIKDRTKNAQFIIISLRNDMFELSQRLIGIYKTSNQTRSISIDNRNLHSFLPSSSLPDGSTAGGSFMNGSVAA